MQTHYTQRKTRTYKQLDRIEKRQMLVMLEREGVQPTLRRYNIDYHTLGIVRKYDAHLRNVPLTLEDRLHLIKVEGGTSDIAAAKLRQPLELINSLWPTV